MSEPSKIISPQNKTNNGWFWLAVIIALLGFLFLIKAVLLPFVVGMLVAYFLDPAADWLEEKGLSRIISTVIITGSFFATTVVVSLILLPIIFNQLAELVHALPEYVALAQDKYSPMLESLLDKYGQNGGDTLKKVASGMVTDASNVAIGFLTNIFRSGMALVNLIMLFLITPVVAFYFLHDWDDMTARIDELLPRRHAETIREQFTKIDITLSGFIRGQMNVCMILGLFYALALSLAGLKFAIVIGLMAGVLIIIPYVGTMLSGIVAIGLAYLQFDGVMIDVGIIAAIFVSGQMMEGYFFTPRFVGEKVGLHPVWIIFGMLVGGALFGFVGILIAVPVTAVIGVGVRFAIEQYLGSELYGSEVKKITKEQAKEPVK